MIMKPVDGRTEADAKPACKAWTKPSVIELRAGAAEAIPGFVISDATLEAIGS